MDLAQKFENLAEMAATPLQKGIVINGYIQTLMQGGFRQKEITRALHKSVKTEAQKQRVWIALQRLIEQRSIKKTGTEKIRGGEKLCRNVYASDLNHPVVDLVLLTTHAMRTLEDTTDSIWSQSNGGGFNPDKIDFRYSIKPLYLLAMYGIAPDELEKTPEEWGMIESKPRTADQIGDIFGDTRKNVVHTHLQKLLDAGLVEIVHEPQYAILGNIRQFLQSRPNKLKGKIMRRIEAYLDKEPGFFPNEFLDYENLAPANITPKDLSRFAREHPELIGKNPKFTRIKEYEIMTKGRYYTQNVIIPLIQILQGYAPPIAQHVRSLPLRELRSLERYVHQKC